MEFSDQVIDSQLHSMAATALRFNRYPPLRAGV